MKQNRTKQSSIQFRQTAKISLLSSGNISKYDFLTDKDVLSEKDLLGKLKHKLTLQKKVSKIRWYLWVWQNH